MQNKDLIVLTTKQAMAHKNLSRVDFYAFIANNQIPVYNPTNPGKRTKKAMLVYKLSDLDNVPEDNNPDMLLTLNQALKLVPFKRISFRKFIKIHGIKKNKPLSPNEPDKSGQIQQYRKSDILKALNNSIVTKF